MLADQMSSTMITPYDLKRLEQYASNMADYHLIMDLVPSLAKLHFLYEVDNLNKPNLGAVQQAILAGIGLQCKSVDTLASELDVPASQLLGLMNTMLRKYTANIKGCQEAVIASSLASKVSQGEAKASAVSKAPLAGSMNDELEAAAADLKAKQQVLSLLQVFFFKISKVIYLPSRQINDPTYFINPLRQRRQKHGLPQMSNMKTSKKIV